MREQRHGRHDQPGPVGVHQSVTASNEETETLRRSIDWKGAFWVASGVPALVLFSIGQVAGAVGKLSFLIWSLSILMGFVQSFTYAEIAGLFPNKSGGASIYGAAAWVRYSKTIAPLSVWCNWLAWSPVLSLGCTIAAAYVLTAIAPLHDFTAWTLFTQTFGPVTISFNAAFFVGAVLMLITFAIQHRGIGSTANIQKYLGLLVIVPLVIVGVVPILSGHVHYTNFTHLIPPSANGAADPGHWNLGGWTLLVGGMFLAAWSTYAFETAICYTSEFRNPGTDTSKAIFYSGLLCIGLFILGPFTFQGVLGVAGMLAAPTNDGSGVAAALAEMVGGIFAFVNAAFMGAGAKVWNPWTLAAGALAASLILPVFWYRHYVQDKGRFPGAMLEDLRAGRGPLIETRAEKKAGVLPYLTLAAGIAVVLTANYFFKL
jgi:amino acid transporter